MLQANPAIEVESSYAWTRLAAAVAIGAIGTVGMWSVPVVMAAVQSEFGAARAGASLPFTLAMVGFALGGVWMGRLADRFGIIAPLACGAALMGLGYIGAGLAPTLTVFALMHILIGLGASAGFGPIMADASRWFTRRRGIAVALAGSGNYLGGAIWPPVLQHLVAAEGWRATHLGLGVFCFLSFLPLLLLFVRRPPAFEVTGSSFLPKQAALGISPNALQVLLCLAGVGCCVAMAMPQVHLVAYCGDLGYGVARGAEMLSLMLACGLVSRVASGLVADRIGGAATLLLGSALQGLALFLYLLFDGLASLYVISALFGLFQGGIVPMYAVLVRDYFPAREAGTRLGIVLMATLFGMALGGWMSGVIFDLTGSYHAAFLNGLVWNLLNVTIVLWLVLRPGTRLAAT
ncbi:MAG TPA: MFS transporter [Xanthobacteraceae bacterium]|jgi:MFS family permease